MNNFFYQKQISIFKHWTRKSYAIFQSLKLQIKISTISVAMLLLGFAQESQAQTNEPKQAEQEVSLDTLEVMGELTPELESELARQVQVIEAASLELNPIQSLQDVLNSMPQVDIRTRGNNDIQADLNIRGSNFDQVQILLNGFDMTDPQTGHHSLNLPITFSQISRIELLAGPGSRVLGPNAYAGAVNFATPKPNADIITLNTIVGDFGLLNMSASIALKSNKFSHYFATNYSSSKGYIENTDFKRTSLFYYGDYSLKKAELSWQLAYSDKAFGANSFYTPKYPNQFEQLRTVFGGVRFKTKGRISTSTQFHYRGNADRFELIRDGYESPAWYSHHNYHFNQVYQFTSKAWTWWKLGKTSIAANVRNEEIYSNVLGSEVIDTMQAYFDSEGYYNKHDNRLYTTISMEHVYVYKKFKISAGLMYYYFPKTNNENGVFPGIDMSYSVNNSLKFYAGINKGMRLPTFTDLYYNGPSNIGNPDLLAESQVAYQIGSKFDIGFLKFNAEAFYNDADNSIDWVRKSDTVKWQPINITNVQSYGFDISVAINTKDFKGDFIKNLSFNYSYINKQSSSSDYQSHYVMDYLKNKFVINLEHNIYKNLSLGYNFRYNDRFGEYQKYNANDKSFVPQNYDDFALLDLRLNWKHDSWHVYADLSNVFNKQYQDYGNLEQPGRWFSLGVKYKIIL